MRSFDEAMETAVHATEGEELRERYTAFCPDASSNASLFRVLCMHASVFIDHCDDHCKNPEQVIEFMIGTTLFSVFILGLVVGREMEKTDIEKEFK